MSKNETTSGSPKKGGLKWKEVTIGGVSGILLGGAGTFAATASTIGSIEELLEEETATEKTAAAAEEATGGIANATVTAHGNVASGVNDHMSFNEAFAAARNGVGAGGCFVWHGNVFSTYHTNEWNAMTPAQRDEFTAQSLGVDTSHSHDTGTYAHQSPGTHNTEVSHHEEENNTGENDLAVEVLGVEQIQNEDGSVSNIGVAGINGQAVYFIDVDGQDGEFDLMAVDLNNNNNLEENEITDISDQHLSVSQFQELAQVSGNGSGSGNEVEEYYASNENLPDYVNDADPVDLA